MPQNAYGYLKRSNQQGIVRTPQKCLYQLRVLNTNRIVLRYYDEGNSTYAYLTNGTESGDKAFLFFFLYNVLDKKFLSELSYSEILDSQTSCQCAITIC